MLALSAALFGTAVVLTARTLHARPEFEFDPDRPIAVFCPACERDFTMPYGQYKQAVDARTDLDHGIRCVECGAEKSVWRSWKDLPPAGPATASTPHPDADSDPGDAPFGRQPAAPPQPRIAG